MSHVLSLSNVTVAYGEHKALDSVTLALPRWTTVGLVGESGSGKSTLARVIAGLMAPQAGELTLDGVVLPRRRTKLQHKRIQMVFQNPDASLNPRLTVRQTLAEALRFHDVVPRDQVEQRCRLLLERVQLGSDALGRLPHEFSGGQRQRLAIARAIAVEPEVLVADEPTSALDVSVQRSVLELLRQLKTELPLTLLLISHDLGVIHALSDNVTVLRRGVVVETGPSAEFFASPQSAYGRELLAAVPRMP